MKQVLIIKCPAPHKSEGQTGQHDKATGRIQVLGQWYTLNRQWIIITL